MIELNKHMVELAQDTLSTFDLIAETARRKLGDVHGIDAGAFVHGNTFTNTGAAQQLAVINREMQEGYEHLIKEPAIARLVLEDESGNVEVLYVARKSQVALSNGKQLASYHSPKGRLASLPVGDALELGGRELTVIESTLMRPRNQDLTWDAIDTRFSNEHLGQQTVPSLRALLRTLDVDVADEFEAMLIADATAQVIKQGLVHQIRKSMGLRDQPILDKFQDEIFRLPLNSKLMIMGPPGTGKTTTLIKRLSQKLNTTYLDEREQMMAIVDFGGREHSKSWVMFTPTELLKHYLKEAFNREEVPASENHIVTWDSRRRYLARNVLGLLQANDSKGNFVLKGDLQLLSDSVLTDPVVWYELVARFHQGRLFAQLTDGADVLRNMQNLAGQKAVGQILELMTHFSPHQLVTLYSQLLPLEKNIKATLDSLISQTQDQLKRFAQIEYKKEKTFFSDMAGFLTQLDIDEDDDDVVFDGEEGELGAVQSSIGPVSTKEALDEYIKAIIALARSSYQKKRLSPTGRANAIVKWLNQRLPDDEALLEIGQRAAGQNALRRFLNAHRRYASDISISYRAFRKQNSENLALYQKNPEHPKHLSQTELDGLVLLALRNARELMRDRTIATSKQGEIPDYLGTILTNFYNQILVDEATDFSVLQLSAMRCLTSLNTESFFACGDFNQRITEVGVRSISQLQWVADDLEVRRITTVYRQSRLLNNFAGELLRLTAGDVDAMASLPDSAVHEGYAPLLLENTSDMRAISNWLARSISNIEHQIRPLPTTAVLVQNDEEVQRLAVLLNQDLENYGLKADACLGGQTLGEGNNVRIFAIEHIKGLEFEAVFFIGVDALARSMPDLFEKFLYVGFTRAATYLGVTCEATLPTPLNAMRESFTDAWR